MILQRLPVLNHSVRKCVSATTARSSPLAVTRGLVNLSASSGAGSVVWGSSIVASYPVLSRRSGRIELAPFNPAGPAAANQISVIGLCCPNSGGHPGLLARRAGMAYMSASSGCSSVVEHELPKLKFSPTLVGILRLLIVSDLNTCSTSGVVMHQI